MKDPTKMNWGIMEVIFFQVFFRVGESILLMLLG